MAQAFYRAGLGEVGDLGGGPNFIEATGTCPTFDDVANVNTEESFDEGEHPDIVMADFIVDHFGTAPRPSNSESPAHEGEGITNLEKEASTPIFNGASTNRLAFIMIFLKIQAKHPGMTNVCLDDVLLAINDHVINKNLESKIPRTRAEARRVVTEIGLDYSTIDACPCDYFLYYGEIDSTLNACPKCNRSRYKEGLVSKKVPRKVSFRCFMGFKHCSYHFRISHSRCNFVLRGV